MQRSHDDFGDCELPHIKNLLSPSGYVDSNGAVQCECSSLSHVYTPEWDSEHREYFDKLSAGVHLFSMITEAALNAELDKLYSEPPPNLVNKIEEIPKEHRNRLLELIQELTRGDIPAFLDRTLLNIGGEYKGYIDSTPLGGISEVFLKPPEWMSPPRYYVTCKRTYNPRRALFRSDLGEEIECVPYIKAQREIGVCAQYSVRLALMTLSDSAPTVPELTFKASRTTLRGGIERQQDMGWDTDEISQIIENQGYSTFSFTRHLCEECSRPLRSVKCSECEGELSLNVESLEPTIENIYAYVESGIPVLIGVKNVDGLPWWNEDSSEQAHALVGIGHTLSDEGDVDGLIVHDVSTYPYQVLSDETIIGDESLESIITAAIAPVYREVTVRYPQARSLALQILENAELEDYEYRPMLMEASTVKHLLTDKAEREHFENYSLHKSVIKGFTNAYLDRYVWLFELKKRLDNNKLEYAGDILVSATDNNFLGLNLPTENILIYRDQNKEFVNIDY